jgi:hypothetical protein
MAKQPVPGPRAQAGAVERFTGRAFAVDALDEARLRVTQTSFEDFLVDVHASI